MNRSIYCYKCKAVKENPNDGYCNNCKREKGRIKSLRLNKREKNYSGLGRKINCSSCGKQKEPGRENESRCKQCKSDAYKANRAKRRAEKGLLPFGSGRNPLCYICKALKENPNSGWCLACARDYDNEWRIRTGRTKKHQDGLCPSCGKERKYNETGYCKKCNNIRSAKWKREHPKTGEDLHKYKIRQLTRYAIIKGYIKQLPCEVCGTNENVEAHHESYDDPFNIRFLCRNHHREHHKGLTKQ